MFELCHPDGMAGGMDRRPFRSASLAERTRRPGTGVPAGQAPASHPEPGTPDGSAAVVTGEPRRHCWVVDGVQPTQRAAGLLVEWRQLGGAWQGRVAYVVGVDGEPTLVEAWLPASQLRQADGA